MTTLSRPWEEAAWTGETGRVDDWCESFRDQLGLRPETTTAKLCGHCSCPKTNLATVPQDLRRMH